MNLMEFFSNYSPKATLSEAETEKGNTGNRPITPVSRVIAGGNTGNTSTKTGVTTLGHVMNVS